MNPSTQRKIDQVKSEIDKEKEKFASADPKHKDADVQKKKLQGLQDVIARFKDQATKADKTKEGLNKMVSSDIPAQKAKKKSGMVMNTHAGELSTQHHHLPGNVHTATKTKTFGASTKITNHSQTKWTKGQAESVETNMENIEEARYNHDDNRRGFGKRQREDDEYHVPDPVDNREKHTIRMKLSKDGGPIQHKQMDVKTLHGAEHAKNFAHDQARKQGWTVHEETEVVEAKVAATATVRAGLAARGRKEPSEAEKAEKKKDQDDAWERLMAHAAAQKAKKTNEQTVTEGAYEKAEENKRSADAAKSQARPFDYHMHMADHHDNMSQWHASKGRHGEADKHAQKSDEHHQKAMAVKEEVAANNVGGGEIAGTKGDAGKKAVMTKEPLKRRLLSQFKTFIDKAEK